jgi:hypothetical protein
MTTPQLKEAYQLDIRKKNIPLQRLVVEAKLTVGKGASNDFSLLEDIGSDGKWMVFLFSQDVLSLQVLNTDLQFQLNQQTIAPFRIYLLEASDKITFGEHEILVRFDQFQQQGDVTQRLQLEGDVAKMLQRMKEKTAHDITPPPPVQNTSPIKEKKTLQTRSIQLHHPMKKKSFPEAPPLDNWRDDDKTNLTQLFQRQKNELSGPWPRLLAFLFDIVLAKTLVDLSLVINREGFGLMPYLENYARKILHFAPLLSFEWPEKVSVAFHAHLLAILSMALFLQLFSTILMGKTLGQNLLGLRAETIKNFQMSGIKILLHLARFLFGLVTGPFLIFDWPLLTQKPSLKEKMSQTLLLSPSLPRLLLGSFLAVFFTASLNGITYLLTPYLNEQLIPYLTTSPLEAHSPIAYTDELEPPLQLTYFKSTLTHELPKSWYVWPILKEGDFPKAIFHHKSDHQFYELTLMDSWNWKKFLEHFFSQAPGLMFFFPALQQYMNDQNISENFWLEEIQKVFFLLQKIPYNLERLTHLPGLAHYLPFLTPQLSHSLIDFGVLMARKNWHLEKIGPHFFIVSASGAHTTVLPLHSKNTHLFNWKFSNNSPSKSDSDEVRSLMQRLTAFTHNGKQLINPLQGPLQSSTLSLLAFNYWSTLMKGMSSESTDDERQSMALNIDQWFEFTLKSMEKELSFRGQFGEDVVNRQLNFIDMFSKWTDLLKQKNVIPEEKIIQWQEQLIELTLPPTVSAPVTPEEG